MMFIFKCGNLIIFATFILSLCYQFIPETIYLNTGLDVSYMLCGIIAGKIIYDRHQHIHILDSLTPNPNVTSFTNKIASVSASFLSLGFLVYIFLFIIKVDNHCLTALSIFICGFGTIYMWMQSILTTYIATLYFDQNISILRQYLAHVSLLILVVMAVFGTAMSFIPQGATTGMYVCVVITSLCSYMLTAVFCIFILSFEKDYEYFTEGLHSGVIIDDGSISNESYSDMDSLIRVQNMPSKIIIKPRVECDVVS